ncbi:MAG: TonB-dependent receptor plug domain-containing protein [Burkholderiales bacterium]|jgi:iron complex outermembrane receptor protein|nr:TonB-dependent receptor [Betaproteobacteria bacterium]
MKIKKITQAVGLVLAGSMIATTPAFAQDAAKVEKIEVTGSNIKRVDAEGPLPVTVISRDEIDRSAAATIGDFVRNLTVNSGGSGGDGEFNGASAGSAGISLRGLGQKSTLVLINGRRMANHAFARNLQDTFVDINSIPKGAIERIEVLKDGASAIYGSDAIAGVVNFIMRKDYTGGVIGASAGRSTEGGLGERSMNLSFGFGNLSKDRYNVFATIDYMHRDRLLLTDRKFIGQGDMSRFGIGNPFLSSSAGTWVSVAPQAAFAQGQLATVPPGTPTGVRRAAFATCLGNGFRQTLVPFAPLAFSTGTVCANSVAPFITTFPEVNRLGFLSRATFDLKGGTTSFTEVSLASNESKLISQHQSMTNVTQVFDPVTQGSRLFNPSIPVGNASNPFPTAYQLRYTFFDVGAREIKLQTDAYRVLTGLNGNAGKWEWEAAIGMSESKVKEDTSNQVDALALRNAITNNTYNFLAPTPAQTAALRIATQRNSTSKLTFGDAKATTTLGTMAGGDIGFAVGMDARREAINDTPDAFARGGRLLGTGSSITNGSRNVVAAYSEMVLPLAKVFEVQLAVRGDRYSDFGSALSPKVGAKWTPYDSILVRASHNRGFRAPTLTENTQTTSLTLTSVTGIPGGVSVIYTGNPNLKAEKSESTSIGIVWEPTKTISMSADWYYIVQRDLVSQNGTAYIVANPTLFAADIVRDSTGAITTIFDRYNNVAKVVVEGIDAEARWTVMSGKDGRLVLRTNGSYLASFQQPPAINQAIAEFAGGNAGPRGALPRTKAKIGVDYDYAGFAFSVNGNFTSGYAQKRVGPFATTQTRVPSQSTVDLSVAYSGIKNLKLFANVQNAGDKQPPFDASVGYFDVTQYDLRGRYVRAGVEYKFK